MLIQLGEISIHLIYPLLISIFRNFRAIIFNLLQIKDKFQKTPFITSCFMFLSQILFSLPGLKVSSFSFSSFFSNDQQINNQGRPKKGSKNITTLATFAKVDSEQEKSSLTIRRFCLIILITFLSIIESNAPSLITSFAKVSTALRYQLKIIDILFIAVLAFAILRTPLYRHQYISLGFIVLGLFFVLFVTIDYEYKYILYKGPWFLWLISLVVVYAIYGLQTTLEKWLMHNRFFSAYKLLFFEGICGLIITFIIEILLSVYAPHIEQPVEFFRNIDWRIILYLIAYILLIGSVCLFGLLTNKYFSPTHLAISDTFTSMLYWIITFIIEQFTWDNNEDYHETKYPFKIMSLFGYILIIIGAFVYNEIIIIKLWNISYYTKVEINNRANGNVKETMDIESLSLSSTLIYMIDDKKENEL